MTTRKGNESIVHKENCLVEEIKEVKLRSRRGRAPSRLPMTKLNIGTLNVHELF